MLIDSHTHIFDLENCDKIIQDMYNDNISDIVSVAYDLDSSKKSVELAQNNKNIYATAGVHPSYAQSFEGSSQEILNLCKHPKVVAIGEIGLDYHYENLDKQVQKSALISQLRLAKISGLPVVFHLRDAYEDMYEIIKSNLDCLTHSAVMHCFSGSKEVAKQYLDLGFYISFSGAITFKNAKKAIEVISSIPKDRLLIETDCPYLSPEPHRGKINVPKNVMYVANKIANLWEQSTTEVERITSANTKRVFSKMI